MWITLLRFVASALPGWNCRGWLPVSPGLECGSPYCVSWPPPSQGGTAEGGYRFPPGWNVDHLTAFRGLRPPRVELQRVVTGFPRVGMWITLLRFVASALPGWNCRGWLP